VAGGSFHEGKTKPYTAEDFRFTTAGGYLYAIELGWPEGEEVLIHSIDSGVRVKGVRLLGGTQGVSFRQDAQGLHLRVPARRLGAYAWVYRIETG
jgi:alpha-L-fucosidase